MLTGLIKHHQRDPDGHPRGDQSRNPGAIVLATSTISSQQVEISTMTGLLAKL